MSAPADAGIALRHDGPGNHRAACPQCGRGPKDAALSVSVDPCGDWVAYCHRCHWTTSGRDDRRATRVGPQLPVDRQAPAGSRETLASDWRRFWNACQPCRGTPAESYLTGRSCSLPPEGSDLRYHPRAWHWIARKNAPALVGLATDAITGEARTLHLTFLRDEGSGKADMKPARLLLAGHRKAGAVVRAWPDEDVTTVLGIAEGIESALSLAWAGFPCWAAIDAGNLAAFPLLNGIEELVVAVDRDSAGDSAAKAVARRWASAGRAVRLVRPRAGDLNDVAQGTYGDD